MQYGQQSVEPPPSALLMAQSQVCVMCVCVGVYEFSLSPKKLLHTIDIVRIYLFLQTNGVFGVVLGCCRSFSWFNWYCWFSGFSWFSWYCWCCWYCWFNWFSWFQPPWAEFPGCPPIPPSPLLHHHLHSLTTPPLLPSSLLSRTHTTWHTHVPLHCHASQ